MRFFRKCLRCQILRHKRKPKIMDNNRQQQVGAGKLDIVVEGKSVGGKEVLIKLMGHGCLRQTSERILYQLLQGDGLIHERRKRGPPTKMLRTGRSRTVL